MTQERSQTHSGRRTRSTEAQEKLAHALFQRIGPYYGLIFGISFALFTWGYDSYILVSNSAAYAWVKLLLSFPIVLGLSVLTGWLASRSFSVGISATLWAIAGGLLGMLAGHLPFAGYNLAVWLADERFWGMDIFHYSYSAEVRTTILVFTLSVLGAIIGVAERQILERVWDNAFFIGDGASKKAKVKAVSLVWLLLCIPLALLTAVVTTELINQPLNEPQRVVGRLVQLANEGDVETANAIGLGYSSIKPFQNSLSDQFTTHFVSFSIGTEMWYSAYVDVAFDNKFVMRCVTAGDRVVYCDDFSKKFAGWMGDLVHAGLSGEQRWLEDRMKLLDVEEPVIIWLEDHKAHLSESYDVTRTGQQGGWIFMNAQFDTGFEMQCRFHEATPVIVDQCIAVSPAQE